MYRINRKTLVFCLIFLTWISLFSQDTKYFTNKSVSVYATYGFIPDKKYEYQHLLNGFIKSINIDLGKTNLGNQFWHKYYNFPETGFNLFFYDLSNKEQLGIITGIIPYIHVYPFGYARVYSGITFGIGLAYANKKYDRFMNPQNTLLGSHLNAAINTGIDIRIVLLKNMAFFTGISLMHFSNGNTKIPNDGINSISSKTGIIYYLSDKVKYDDFVFSEKLKSIEYAVSGSLSLTNCRSGINNGFIFYNLMLEASKPINPVYSVGFGVDYEYNTSDTSEIIDIELRYIPIVNHQVGLKAINTFKFSKLEFLLQFGVDLLGNKWIYDWIIFRYKIYKGLKVNMSYKSYLLRGDHLGWGITYGF